MKFAFLSSYAHLALDPASNRVSGGAELQVALLARELARRGHEVSIISGDIGQPEEQTLQGVRILNGGKFQTGGLADTARALPKVWGLLRRERPHCVALLGCTTWLYFLLQMRRFLDFRLIFICGLDTEVNGEYRRAHPCKGALFEQGVRRSDLRYAMTEDQARMFAQGGMDCRLYRNLILERSTPYQENKAIDLLWIARCQPIKRPHLFLDLVEAMPEARCEMICPREDEALWQSVAKRAESLKNLQFIERVPYHQVQAHYDRAELFVNTSTYEGWPNSFIQAGLGRTALLSLAVNPDQLFAKYQLGAFTSDSLADLISRARRFLNDPVARREAQAECHRFVCELHDNTKNTDAFLAGLAT